MPDPLPRVSIIVPTFREAPNVKPLVERTFAATQGAGIDAEMVIVDDDSHDGTVDAVAALAKSYELRLVVRRGERGLSGAVLRGFAEAKHDVFVVMDADLQHPPEAIPRFVKTLESSGCDMVVGTRYGEGGGISDDWPIWRKLGSAAATQLAKPLVPLSDPMSGFFALRREVWIRAKNLNPVGYKIALELYVKGRCRSSAEVPIRFSTREAGASKAGAREMIRYVRHLGRLYRFRFPILSAMVMLIVVLGAATIVFLLVR